MKRSLVRRGRRPGTTLPNVFAAGALLYAAPIVILFIVLQRFLVRGIVTTGLKPASKRDGRRRLYTHQRPVAPLSGGRTTIVVVRLAR